MRVCSRKAFFEWSLNSAVLSAEKVRNETVDSPLMPRQAADSLVLVFNVYVMSVCCHEYLMRNDNIWSLQTCSAFITRIKRS